jgi:hypothetical protein
MSNKPYNAKDHALYLTTYDGITFVGQGEPDADFIAVTYVNDSTTAAEGAKGDVQFSQRIASLGNILFTCQWGSPTNDNLNQVYADQQKGNYLQSAEVKRISNTENITVWSAINPKIVKPADYTVGIAVADRGWNFLVEKLTPGEKLAPA